MLVDVSRYIFKSVIKAQNADIMPPKEKVVFKKVKVTLFPPRVHVTLEKKTKY